MQDESVSRREFLKLAGIAGASVGLAGGLGGLAAACGSEETTTTAAAPATTTTVAPVTATTAAVSSTTITSSAEKGRPIKLGLVSATTGVVAFFSMSEKWWIPHFKKAIGDGVVCGDGKSHTFDIVTVDAQSDGARAAQVAGDLILNQKVDLIMCSASGLLTIPTSAQAEALGCPCLVHFTVPEAHVALAGPAGLKWTYMYTWSSAAAIAVLAAAFAQVPSNKKVGLVLPNDDDGISWQRMAPGFLKAQGFEVTETGLYQHGTEDWGADISAFKKAGCELLLHSGAVPSDFATLWQQCLQQSYHPKAATGGAAILFPSSMKAIGDIGLNLMAQGGWTPDLPFKDSLTGQTCPEVASEFEEALGMQWDLTITNYVPGEWAVDIFKRSADIESKDATIKSIQGTKMETILGPLDMTAAVDPKAQTVLGRWNPNIVQPPSIGIQWVKGAGKWPYDQEIVVSLVPDLVKTTSTMLPMQY